MSLMPFSGCSALALSQGITLFQFNERCPAPQAQTPIDALRADLSQYILSLPNDSPELGNRDTVLADIVRQRTGQEYPELTAFLREAGSFFSNQELHAIRDAGVEDPRFERLVQTFDNLVTKHQTTVTHTINLKANEQIDESVQELLESGVSPDLIKVDDKHVLIWASGHGTIKTVRAILKKEADVDTTDSWERTPAFAAAYNGRLDVMKELIKAGTDLTQADEDGETPLDYADKQAARDMIKFLVKNGASSKQLRDICERYRIPFPQKTAPHSNVRPSSRTTESGGVRDTVGVTEGTYDTIDGVEVTGATIEDIERLKAHGGHVEINVAAIGSGVRARKVSHVRMSGIDLSVHGNADEQEDAPVSSRTRSRRETNREPESDRSTTADLEEAMARIAGNSHVVGIEKGANVGKARGVHVRAFRSESHPSESSDSASERTTSSSTNDGSPAADPEQEKAMVAHLLSLDSAAPEILSRGRCIQILSKSTGLRSRDLDSSLSRFSINELNVLARFPKKGADFSELNRQYIKIANDLIREELGTPVGLYTPRHCFNSPDGKYTNICIG